MNNSLRSFLAGVFLWLTATGALAAFTSGGHLMGFWSAAAGGCGTSGVSFLQEASTGTGASLTDGVLSMGAASACRVLVISLSVIEDGGTDLTVTAVDVDEIAFTQRATISKSTGGIRHRISIWTGAVPTGTSGLLDYTLSGAPSDATSVAAWRVVTVDDADGVPTDTGTATDAGPLNTVTIPASGVAVFSCSTDAEGGATMTNAGSQRYDRDQGTDGGHTGYDGATAGTTPSVVCSSASGEAYAGVAFGP